MPDYQTLSQDEVLRLVLEKDQLTEEARLALDAEVARRGLSEADFRTSKAEEAAAMRARQKELQRGTLQQANKKLKGKKNYSHDFKVSNREFDTTLWIVAFWIPVIPLASFRVRREFFDGGGISVLPSNTA